MRKRADISSVLLIGAGAAFLTACGGEPHVAPPPETRAERLAMLDQIASECQVPRAMIELVGEDQLKLKPGRDEAYEKVGCVIRRIEALDLPAGHVTFVNMAAPGPRPETNGVAAREADNAVAPETNNAKAH